MCDGARLPPIIRDPEIHHKGTKDTKKTPRRMLSGCLLCVLCAFVVNLRITYDGREPITAAHQDGNAMTADDLIALNEQIAGMARAGLPLDQGLASLAREMDRGRLRRVTESIAEDLRAGQTLPDALSRRQGELPPFYAGLVTAGVRSGRLPDVLATLTTYARTIATTRATV